MTAEYKAKCMESALIFLQYYHDDGDEFLDRIITGDETWIAHITPETARRAGSDGSMSASDSAGPGFNPQWGSKFSFENVQPRG